MAACLITHSENRSLYLACPKAYIQLSSGGKYWRRNVGAGSKPGLPDFSWYNIPNWGKYTK
jgi:hypothetical protein